MKVRCTRRRAGRTDAWPLFFFLKEGYFFWEFFPVFFWDFFPVFWWKEGARKEGRKEGMGEGSKKTNRDQKKQIRIKKNK
jgi:hypothetical protein